MSRASLLVLTTFAIGLVGAAQAQQSGEVAVDPAAHNSYTPKYVKVEQEDRIVPQFNKTIRQLQDMGIYGADGSEIGGVNKVMADTSGNVAALTANVGDREVLLSLDQVKLSGDRLTTNLTKQQVGELPKMDQ